MFKNVQKKQIIAMLMPPAITLLVHSSVHVSVDSQEVGLIVKVQTKHQLISYTNKTIWKIIYLVVTLYNLFLDIDECINETYHCHANATCTNTVGSFICSCEDGFTGNGTYCEG